MDNSRVDSTQSSSNASQVTCHTEAAAKNGTHETNGMLQATKQQLPLNSIHKVSLVKLSPLPDNMINTSSSPLSPNTLTKLVEEQTKSHEAIEALQQRIQSETPNSFTSEVRKELEQSALKQRQFLNQVLSTPSSISQEAPSVYGLEQQVAMLEVSNTDMVSKVSNHSPLAKKLFPDDFHSKQIIYGNGRDGKMLDRGPGIESWVESGKHSTRKNSLRRNKKSDTDNDTGVESDGGSDPGSENPSIHSPTFSDSHDTERVRDFSTVRQSTPSRLKSTRSQSSDEDQLLLYLEEIERRALEVESLIEKAKLDTVVNLRCQLEAEFNGVPLEDIPSKCHEKIDRAIQRYLQHELENIRAEYENKESVNEESGCKSGLERVRMTDHAVDLESENAVLREKIKSLESSVTRVDMLYDMKKKENEYLTEKVSKLERQMANEKLKYESELDSVKNGYEEEMRTEKDSLKERLECYDGDSSQRIASLYRKLEQEEKQNVALKVAVEADKTTIRCLEEKVSQMEEQLRCSRDEVSDLLSKIQELHEKEEQYNKKLKKYQVQLKEVMDERHILRETLIMSEHEISLLENKLGNENNPAWKESKKEILEELRELEKHIKVIHKEKRKLENKCLAFRIENENLSDSLHSFSRTKDILNPLGSCDVSRRDSSMSSHSSSLSSSLAGSDVEDEGTYDGHGSRNRSEHPSERRKRRAQEQKEKQFAEAVARKLLFAQKAIKDQNCNFSRFENSGEDLSNEAEELVKRVDSLLAEKRAIKMELESVRSVPTENVKC